MSGNWGSVLIELIPLALVVALSPVSIIPAVLVLQTPRPRPAGLAFLAGWLIGQPMDLDFNPFELVAVAVAVLITNSISSDGKSNWLEGILLLAAYVVLGFAFYFHPVIEGLG